MKNTETLERLCEIVDRRLEMAADELERDNGKLSAADADYLDKLTHTKKSIETTLAMEGYGHSERRMRSPVTGRYVSRDDGSSYEGSYDDGSYDDGYTERHSYNDGQVGGNARRSMHGDDVRSKLRRMMDETRDERVRRALDEAMRKL